MGEAKGGLQRRWALWGGRVLLGLGGYSALIWLLVGMGAVSLLLFALARPPQPQGGSR